MFGNFCENCSLFLFFVFSSSASETHFNPLHQPSSTENAFIFYEYEELFFAILFFYIIYVLYRCLCINKSIRRTNLRVATERTPRESSILQLLFVHSSAGMRDEKHLDVHAAVSTQVNALGLDNVRWNV